MRLGRALTTDIGAALRSPPIFAFLILEIAAGLVLVAGAAVSC